MSQRLPGPGAIAKGLASLSAHTGRQWRLLPPEGGERAATTRAREVNRLLSDPASPAQRAKVRGAGSIIDDDGPCDPAHLVPRSLGGCNDSRCVVPLTRQQHRDFDEGTLDLAPFLIRAGCIREVQHALVHTDGSLLRLIHIVTGKRHVPEQR